ncbi:MAG: ATP-binding cassette domain-containing protein [Chloroflexi bacterium]|nr:ATP-binding cassette domain-containing protein [Chloroflexota bacterium]
MRVELKNIHKHFGAVHANNDVTLTVEGGSIHGLLGENGAGKSTLMKVLSGYIHADGGEISLDGKKLKRFNSPADALRHGVGMLHQDPLDFPPMTLLDNFILGCDASLLQPRARAEKEFRELCQQFNFDLDTNAFVSDLTVGERQQLEIVRLLWLGARTLILDEPTTGISAPQKIKLFATLRQLAADGKSVIFVSHKLEDVEDLCHRVTVLRRGQVAGEAKSPFVTEQLVQMMFGQQLNIGKRPNVELGAPVIEFDHLTLKDDRLTVPDISLSVRMGEVLALAGLEGSGQQLFLQACAGLLPPSAGQLRLNGIDLTRKPYENFLRAGIAYMPADRMKEGLVPGLSIEEHIVLAKRGKKDALIDWRRTRQTAAAQITDFNIKGIPTTRVEALSGGNQQRTLLALLPPDLKLLALEHPTRGLDIESTLYIWGKLLERRKQGAAIIFASADLDEVLQYSDRILVFFGGRVIETVRSSETSVEQLGYLIGGKKQ